MLETSPFGICFSALIIRSARVSKTIIGDYWRFHVSEGMTAGNRRLAEYFSAGERRHLVGCVRHPAGHSATAASRQCLQRQLPGRVSNRDGTRARKNHPQHDLAAAVAELATGFRKPVEPFLVAMKNAPMAGFFPRLNFSLVIRRRS
jgi:hypothetical protein